MTYSGASGRIEIGDLLRLPSSSFVVQPKLDGVYARISLDHRGKVSAVRSRTGRDLSEGRELLGSLLGWPGSVLHGELEAHTERGNADAAARGWRVVHLFDCERAGDTYIGRAPYSARRDALWRMQSEVECYGPSAPWYRDEHGDAHDNASGRYVAPRAPGWRLAPIVPQVRPAAAHEFWQRARTGELEGLVAVALDAPLGRGKLKCKPVSTLDCTVLEPGKGALWVTCGQQAFVVSAAGKLDSFQRGDMVEIAHEGWYSSGLPRFARLMRGRPDLLA